MSEVLENVPPMPPVESADLDVELPGDMPDDTAIETDAEPQRGNFDRGLQREQRRRAELERQVSEMREALTSLQQARSNPPAPDELDEIEAGLTADADAVMPGYTKSMKALIARLRKAEAGRSEKTGTDPDLEQKIAMIEFNSFMAPYPPEYKDAYTKAQKAQFEKGIRGDALVGYMTAWWENYIASKNDSQAEAPRTSKRGTVPPASVRRSQPATNEQLIADRHRRAGGNVLGLDSKTYGR